MYQHKPTSVGVGIGAVGVAVTFLTTVLLILVPQELLTPDTSSAYIDTWARPIMTIGHGVLVYGLPLASAACAYYLSTQNHPPKSVLTGFIIGGLVLVLGDTLLGVAMTHLFADDPAIDRSLLGHVSRNLALGGRLLAGTLIGIAGATLIGERF